MATETNIAKGTFFPGADHTWNVPLTDSAGDPVNAGSWSLAHVIRRPSGEVVVSKATGGSGITLGNRDGTNDLAIVAIDHADTLGKMAPGGGYTWACWRTDGDDDTPLAYGTLWVTAIAGQA